MDKLTVLSYSEDRSGNFTRNFSVIQNYRALHARIRYFFKIWCGESTWFRLVYVSITDTLMNAAQIISVGENTRRNEIRAEPQGLQTSIRFTYRFCSKHTSDIEESSFNTFTAIVDLSRFNNSCLKSPTSTLVDLTFQSRGSALSA